jgi:predicted NBD/HSP70 family sugar kinase
MADFGQWFAVGLDSGGTAINATVIDSAGRFLVDGMVESPNKGCRSAIRQTWLKVAAGR